MADSFQSRTTHSTRPSVRARTDGRVEWVVLDWNESAIGFYRSLGAEPVDGWTRFRWLPDA